MPAPAFFVVEEYAPSVYAIILSSPDGGEIAFHTGRALPLLLIQGCLGCSGTTSPSSKSKTDPSAITIDVAFVVLAFGGSYFELITLRCAYGDDDAEEDGSFVRVCFPPASVAVADDVVVDVNEYSELAVNNDDGAKLVTNDSASSRLSNLRNLGLL